MPWFVKTEQFTSESMKLLPEVRKQYIDKHLSWVINLNELGTTIASGYLVNENSLPGGGGMLIVKANSYQDAKSIIEQDPMIINGLVTWKVQEWVPVFGALIT